MTIHVSPGEPAHAYLATGRMVEATRLLAWRLGRWSGPMDRPCRPDRRRRERGISARHGRAGRGRAAENHRAARGGGRRSPAHRPPHLVFDQPRGIRSRGRRYRSCLARDAGEEFPAFDAALHRWPGRSACQGRDRSHRIRAGCIGHFPMTRRSTSADFVTAFATGWPENQPEIMVLSLTTHKGVQDFALNKEQALLIAKTMKETAARLARPKQA